MLLQTEGGDQRLAGAALAGQWHRCVMGDQAQHLRRHRAVRRRDVVNRVAPLLAPVLGGRLLLEGDNAHVHVAREDRGRGRAQTGTASSWSDMRALASRKEAVANIAEAKENQGGEKKRDRQWMKTEKPWKDEGSTPGAGGSRQSLSPDVADVTDEAKTFERVGTATNVKLKQ